MMGQVELSEEQKQIVLADEGALYVAATAGSGKTRVLTERIRYLLSKTKKKVLALTFTNKAGEEIRERLGDVVDLERRAFIGTFHGFCQSVLENHGNLVGLTKMPHIFEDEVDRLELVEQAIENTPSFAIRYKAGTSKEQRETRYNVLNFISEIKRNLISDSEYSNHTDNEDYILLYKNYQDILRSQNAIDFDDLLLQAYNLFVAYPKTAALYRRSFYAICVDEAQDLNNAQYQFLTALTANDYTNLMMVGDPNQAIYHFNGSSSDYMSVNFVSDFDPEIHSLTENYRSSKAVRLAVKNVFPNAEEIAGTVKEGQFEICSLTDAEVEAEWVCKKILSLTASKSHEDIEGEIRFEKIAVLARNKYVFSPLESKLKEEGIPSHMKMSAGAFKFESNAMKIFDLALRVKINPLDVLHKKRLFDLLQIKGVDFKYPEQISLLKNKQYVCLIENVIALREDGSNLKKAIDRLEENLSIDDENEKNMVLQDLNALRENWYNYAKKSSSRSLQQFKNAMSLGRTNPLTQETGLTLSTVHTMKGQEFDIVFIVGMDDETFPDYRAIRAGGIDLAQEKNNLYVALTRARRFLYITWPEKRKMPWGDFKHRKISRFLENI